MEKLPAEPPKGIALYDLDGTLLAWDCQLLFRHHVVRREPWRLVFLPVFLAAVPLAPLLGTARMKRIFLSFLFGIPDSILAEHARSFAASLGEHFYEEMRGKVEKDRAAGRFLILTSASPEVYAKEVGRVLGFDLTFGTEVKHGAFFPALVNNKNVRKVERLRAILPTTWFAGEKLRNSCGYTDSVADLPLLALCETAVVVNPKTRLQVMAEEAGWEIVRPARPWRNRLGFICRAAGLLFGVTNRGGKSRASRRGTHRV